MEPVITDLVLEMNGHCDKLSGFNNSKNSTIASSTLLYITKQILVKSFLHIAFSYPVNV